MPKKVHPLAGMAAFLIILSFWVSTLVSELFAGYATIALVKSSILWGMLALVPLLILTGVSGMKMGSRRRDALALSKKKRMPFIALNGILILVPSAFFLAARAETGLFDVWFYSVQALELAAGAVNLILMGLNVRDGLRMTGRLGSLSNVRAVAE